MPNVNPSAGRTPDFTTHPLYDQADGIVVKWIAYEEPAPRALSDIVHRYRLIDVQLANADTKTEVELYEQANSLYHKLLEVAILKCRVNVEVAHQARHIDRKDYQRMSFTQKCSQAIASWRSDNA